MDECGLRDGRQYQPRLQGIRLVRAHPWRTVRRRGRGPAGPRVSNGRWRRRHEMPHGNRHQRPPRSRAGQVGPDPAYSPQEHGSRHFHRCPVAVQAEGLSEQPRSDSLEQSVVPFALYVRLLPVRALPQGDGARQGWIILREGTVAALALQLDQRVRRWGPEELLGDGKVPPAARRRADFHHRERGEPRILLSNVRAPASFPARGYGYRPAARLATARRKKLAALV